MILIWGFRFIGRRVGEGTFACPSCRVDRPYVRKLMRRWFTLFWIPLFPVGKPQGEQIVCGTCKHAYAPDVLSAPTTDQLSTQLQTAVRVAAVAMVSVSGESDPVRRRAAKLWVVEAGTVPYDDPELDADLAAIEPGHLAAWITPLGSSMSPLGREQFLRRAVLLADVPPSPQQSALISAIGTHLDLTPAHVAGVVATATHHDAGRTD